jgi:site-specific DNA recombinase
MKKSKRSWNSAAQAGTVRAVAYVRVSSEEQVEGYSLAAQERAVRAYCEAHGWELLNIYPDEGRSAWTDDLSKRPAFARMLEDAETGAFDVLIVHKLDRFARNVIVALETLHELEAHDVGFVSLSESMDFTTPIGKVILTTLASFAEYYSANLSAETKKGKAERKAQGLYNGLLPFGVVKGQGGVPVLDLVPRDNGLSNADGLLMAFELAASGKSDREIAQALNDAGYRTTGNRGANRFTRDTVRPILQNRFCLGELTDGNGGWMPGRHKALLDPVLFEQAQAARAINTSPRIRTAQAASPWALTGLGTCGTCGKPLRLYGPRRVQCSGKRAGLECDEPTFKASMVEDQLVAHLSRFKIPAPERTSLIAEWERAQTRQTDPKAARERLDREFKRLRELYLSGDIEAEEYRARKDSIAAQRAALSSDQRPGTGERLASYMADIAAAWEVATPSERNKIARELFDEVIVENKTAVAVVPRPAMRPFFESIACHTPDEMSRWRKRRGSVERDRLRAATADSHSLPGKRTCVTPATRSRPVRSGGETMPHPKKALARSGRAIELRGPSQYRP